MFCVIWYNMRMQACCSKCKEKHTIKCTKIQMVPKMQLTFKRRLYDSTKKYSHDHQKVHEQYSALL